ncbi:MAG: nuclear transport factor 2 family protein [Microthrixaceae bacterium]
MSSPDPSAAAGTSPATLSPEEISALRDLLDRDAIRDCIGRYARGVDRADEELLRCAYHPDATEDHGAYIGGLDGLIGFLSMAHARFDGYQRYVTNTTIDLDGDTAHAESYYLCVLRRDERDRLVANGGRYVDRLERRDGQWRIARRVVVIEWDGTIEGGRPAHGLNVAPAHGRGDVSYDRPLEVTREHRSPG